MMHYRRFLRHGHPGKPLSRDHYLRLVQVEKIEWLDANPGEWLRWSVAAYPVFAPPTGEQYEARRVNPGRRDSRRGLWVRRRPVPLMELERELDRTFRRFEESQTPDNYRTWAEALKRYEDRRCEVLEAADVTRRV